jgi:hypothetical protein
MIMLDWHVCHGIMTVVECVHSCEFQWALVVVRRLLPSARCALFPSGGS